MSQAQIATPSAAGYPGLALRYSSDQVHVEVCYVDADGVPVGGPAFRLVNDGSVEAPAYYAQRLPGPGPQWQQGEDGRVYMAGT